MSIDPQPPTFRGLSAESRDPDTLQDPLDTPLEGELSELQENQKFEAVFISDLHLHPDMPKIEERFNEFITWAKTHTKTLYILGDFFHVWPGDDCFDAWSLGIVKLLRDLSLAGVNVFFMPGNRDFLIGERFYKESGTHPIKEPHVALIGNTSVLLVHGDRYCTKDTSHQWFRKVTRNSLFTSLFLKIPFKTRNKLVNKVRAQSQTGTYKSDIMSTVPEVVIAHMEAQKINTLIHGHTHKPGLTKHLVGTRVLQQYILSDWDDKPQFLCYDKSKGFHFTHIL